METIAAPPAPPTPASPAPVPTPPPWRRYVAPVALAAFFLYVAMLFVLALDQHYHWGLFPTKADRELSDLVTQLDDPRLTSDKQLALMDQIVTWNTFAVPTLINAIAHAPATERDRAAECLQEISLKFYGKDIADLGVDPVKLNQWWIDQQAEWAKTQAEKKSS
jgi:hypothetical protein